MNDLDKQIADAEEEHFKSRIELEKIEFKYRETAHNECVAADKLLDLILKRKNQNVES